MNVEDIAILVGGRGKRIKKITNFTPKPLIKIGEKCFLDQIISKIIRYDFKNIYLLCSYKKKFFFNRYHNKKIHNSKIKCVDEGAFKGTGGALYKLKNKISKNFILINGDTFFDIDYNKLINFKLRNYFGLIAITENRKLNNNLKMKNINLDKNKEIYFTKKETRLSNGGIYLFSRKIFSLIENKNQSLEDEILRELIIKKKIKGMFFDERFIDIGSYKQLNFLKKNINFIKNKAFFFDRDGVINKEEGYILDLFQFKLLPGVMKAINLLNKKNFIVIIVTNQAAVGKGLLSEQKLFKIHSYMKKKIYKFNNSTINDIFYAPYFKNSKKQKYRINSSDRKPNIGMFKKAKEKWNLDFDKSYFIGDKDTDKIASEKSGIKFYYKKKWSLYSQVRKIINE